MQKQTRERQCRPSSAEDCNKGPPWRPSDSRLQNGEECISLVGDDFLRIILLYSNSNYLYFRETETEVQSALPKVTQFFRSKSGIRSST
jgi:hypothetical protein